MVRAFAVLLSILIASYSISIPDELTYSFSDLVVASSTSWEGLLNSLKMVRMCSNSTRMITR